MKAADAEALLKRFSIAIMAVGGGLTALGLSGYHASRFGSGWDDDARIEIVIGVALFILGMFSRKNTR